MKKEEQKFRTTGVMTGKAVREDTCPVEAVRDVSTLKVEINKMFDGLDRLSQLDNRLNNILDSVYHLSTDSPEINAEIENYSHIEFIKIFNSRLLDASYRLEEKIAKLENLLS